MTTTAEPVITAQVPTLSPAQIASLKQSRAPINLWTGAIRSGKTVVSLLRWLLYVRTAPLGGRLVMIGKTKDTLARNVFAVLQDERLFGRLAREVKYTRGANVAYIFGREVDVIGAHNVDSESRLRGLTAAGAYVDEATLLPQNFWVQLLGRHSLPGAKIFATTNPDSPAHWLRRDYLSRAHIPAVGLRHWHFTLYDNPAITAAKRAQYEAQFTGLFYKRFILGQWVAAEGAIYDMWDDTKHVIPRKKLPMIDRWLGIGVDYGSGVPFSSHTLALGVDNNLYVTDEYRYDPRETHRSMTDASYAEALYGWLSHIERPGTARVGGLDPFGNIGGLEVPPIRGIQPEMVCVDPSARSFRTQLAHDGKLIPLKAANSVLDGIRTVASLLSQFKLFVVEDCRGLINEFPGYAWDDKKRLEGVDEPIKVDDHSLDDLRYVTLTTAPIWRPYVMQDTHA